MNCIKSDRARVPDWNRSLWIRIALPSAVTGKARPVTLSEHSIVEVFLGKHTIRKSPSFHSVCYFFAVISHLSTLPLLFSHPSCQSGILSASRLLDSSHIINTINTRYAKPSSTQPPVPFIVFTTPISFFFLSQPLLRRKVMIITSTRRAMKHV